MITALLRVALFAALASCAHAQTWKPWEGPTPELQARTLAGAPLRLSDYAGRTVLVNFWATWCAPCVAEMPSLERLRKRLAKERVEVIAVNFQENAARIQPFIERLGVTFPVVRDHDGSLRTAWDVSVFPSTFIVDPQQRVRAVAVGEVDWDDPKVQSRLRALQ
ncbi:MAG: TlpA family protein disulfide reductase [Burkholderiales bacterium]|nr:TlpA family protein disulfide reductase [Burkholderiales bacterium]